MIVMAVVDDNNGMMFHGRRQSKDRVLRERMLALAEGEKLWMNAYSCQQFSDGDAVKACEKICVDEEFLKKAGQGDYCFAENVSIASQEDSIEKIILFRWNRKYPSDFKLDIDLDSSLWKLEEVREFSGSSHERITEEVYIRG